MRIHLMLQNYSGLETILSTLVGTSQLIKRVNCGKLENTT